MGQPVTWQYAVVWTPLPDKSRVQLFRISSAGHRFLWGESYGDPHGGNPGVADVLQQLYIGVLELMETTGVVEA